MPSVYKKGGCSESFPAADLALSQLIITLCAQSLILDQPDGYTVVNVTVIHVHAAQRVEVEFPREVQIAARGRPIVAAGAHAAHAATAPAESRGGQVNGITVGTDHIVATA